MNKIKNRGRNEKEAIFEVDQQTCSSVAIIDEYVIYYKVEVLSDVISVSEQDNNDGISNTIDQGSVVENKIWCHKIIIQKLKPARIK